MRGATAKRIAVGIGGLVAVVVVGIVILLAWAIAKGEEQSHDWADQVASTYRSTMPGTSEADVRKELGEPALVAAETIQGRAARCSVYRVLPNRARVGALSVLLRRRTTLVEVPQLG